MVGKSHVRPRIEGATRLRQAGITGPKKQFNRQIGAIRTVPNASGRDHPSPFFTELNGRQGRSKFWKGIELYGLLKGLILL